MTMCYIRMVVFSIFIADTSGDDVLPNVADMCASFQYAIVKHLCIRLQRGMEYCDSRDFLPEGNRFLVSPSTILYQKSKM